MGHMIISEALLLTHDLTFPDLYWIFVIHNANRFVVQYSQWIKVLNLISDDGGLVDDVCNDRDDDDNEDYPGVFG